MKIWILCTRNQFGVYSEIALITEYVKKNTKEKQRKSVGEIVRNAILTHLFPVFWTSGPSNMYFQSQSQWDRWTAGLETMRFSVYFVFNHSVH